MKFRSILFFLFLINSQILISGTFDKGDESALLWKLEGKNIESSYIFGTIHLIPESQYRMTDPIISALSECELLILEMDISKEGIMETFYMNAKMKNGKTLDSLISAEDYKKLDTLCRKQLGQSLENFKTYKPIILSMMLNSVYMDEKPVSYERELLNMAKEQGQPVVGLETPEYQLSILDYMNYNNQAEMLVQLINDTEKTKELFQEMVNRYNKGDINGLNNLFIEYYGESAEAEYLLNERNRNWVKLIPDLISGSSAFIAVGAAHLGGEEGLISLLRKEGYRRTPLE